MQQTKDSLIPLDSLNCFNNKHSIFICTNENCQQIAFMCNNEQCDCIQSKHYGCSSHGTKYLVNSIQKQRRQMTQQNKDAFNAVIKVYQEMIQTISKQKEEFIDFIDMFGLGEHMRKFVGLIRDEKFQEVVGDLAHKVLTEITQQAQKIGKFELDEQTVKKIWEDKNKDLDQMLISLKEFRYQSNNLIDSKIINHDGFTKVKTFIPKPIKKLSLLYRGSENQFSAQKFHQKCDGIQDTITLVETQFGKVIGGYTPVKWQSPQTGAYKADPSGQSFLFSVSLNEKYQLVQKQRATVQNKGYGPNYAGADLYLYNQCNINSNSGGQFPTQYNNGKYQSNQASYTAFSGQTNGYKFRVNQYEVFKVIWK